MSAIRTSPLYFAATTSLGLMVFSACGGALGPEDLAQIEVAAGNNQEAPAGTAVPIPPSVRALSENGEPIPGAIVTFVVTGGNGTLVGGQATTNDEGIAQVTSWVLDPEIGQNVLNATADGTPTTLIFRARGFVGPPAIVEKLAGDEQNGTAGLPVPTVPVVLVTDQFGNPNTELEIAFSAAAGGGSVDAAIATTDLDGQATPGNWTLGNAPGENSLVVTAGAANTTFTATGVSGPVAMEIANGDTQAATVGTSVADQPAVLVTDGLGLPVQGVSIAFAVTAGGGSIDAPNVISDASGNASVTWTVGTTAGNNKLVASLEGIGMVEFNAAGTADIPANLTVNGGNQQFGAINQALPAAPSVRVSDQFGNPVPNVSVSFTITAGGGSITGSPATTTSAGISTAGTWTLGSTEGPNTLDAIVTGLPPLAFSATALGSVFDIEIVQLGSGGPAVPQALNIATTRWEQLIIGDLTDISFATNPIDSATCGIAHPEINDVVDDLRIFVMLEEIDGPGNVLGSAGPCITRSNGGLTVVGVMRFDTDDLNNLDAQGLLDDVMIHEIGHVLGFGTLWDNFNLLVNPSLPNSTGADTHFNGARAIVAFDDAGGTIFTGGSKVPVENSQGGQGTQDSHWRETTLETELMTGFIDVTNQLSAITVESLGDLGYIVNANAADGYAVPGSSPALRTGPTSQRGVHLLDDVYRGPWLIVEQDGVVRLTVRR